MKRWLVLGAGLLLAASMAPRLHAQLPGAAAGAAAGAAPAAGALAPIPGAAPAPAAAPAAQPTTLCSFLGLTQENCAKCRACICKTPLGQLLNSMTMPLGLATGGLVQPLCPPNLQLPQPGALVSPAESAAAAIKAQEAQAAARRAAIRYLGTVDCRRFPEAEKALIAGLRADTNECVRLEAALALSNGCCCNERTIAALALTVSGETTDKNPAECSERVKAAAAYALQVCLSRQCELGCELGGQGMPPLPVPPEAPPPPEEELPPPNVGPRATTAQAGDKAAVQLTSFYTRQLPRLPGTRLTQDAGRTLAATVGTPLEPRAYSPTGHSLFQILENARCPRGVREEIAYDEAALSTASPPAPTPRRPPPPSPSPCLRADLAFIPAAPIPIKPPTAGTASPAAKPAPLAQSTAGTPSPATKPAPLAQFTDVETALRADSNLFKLTGDPSSNAGSPAVPAQKPADSQVVQASQVVPGVTAPPLPPVVFPKAESQKTPEAARPRERKDIVPGELTNNLGHDLPLSRTARPQQAASLPDEPVTLIGAPALLDVGHAAGN